MKTLTILSVCISLGFICFVTPAYVNYFEEGDWENNIIIEFDTLDATNIWQVGVPQKDIFNMSATLPNALLTDTINVIPDNDTSSFQFSVPTYMYTEILAVQWMQKLDYDFEKDGGLLEFTLDGENWENIFTSPDVYNIFGYDEANVGSLDSGVMVFTGQDTTWKNIWTCFAVYNLYTLDFRMRFTSISDSTNSQNDGWMIDNLEIQNTFIHTVSLTEVDNYFSAFPNPSTGFIEIRLKEITNDDYVQQLELIDARGQVMQVWKDISTKFQMDLSSYDDGIYYIRARTKKNRQIEKIVLQR